MLDWPRCCESAAERPSRAPELQTIFSIKASPRRPTRFVREVLDETDTEALEARRRPLKDLVWTTGNLERELAAGENGRPGWTSPCNRNLEYALVIFSIRLLWSYWIAKGFKIPMIQMSGVSSAWCQRTGCKPYLRRNRICFRGH